MIQGEGGGGNLQIVRANHLAAQGDGLKKGDIVMTGSIVTTKFPTGAFNYRFDVTGLGSVEVSGA